MDFTYFLNILLRRKWLILSVSIFTFAATWMLVGKLPPVYKSKAIVSTGIIHFKGVTLQQGNPYIQQYQIETTFNDLIKKMTSRRSIRLLTNRLLLHDLQADRIEEEPFRIPKDEEMFFSKSELDNFALVLAARFDTIEEGTPLDFDKSKHELAKAFEYDYESLLEDLLVQRSGNGKTDYMEVVFKSENAQLSRFAVQAFCEEFFQLFESDLFYEEVESLNFHNKQVEEKKKLLDEKIQAINEFKKNNNLIDIEAQRETVISHHKDLEVDREEVKQKVPALLNAIEILDRQINKYNRINAEEYATTLYLSEDYQQISKELQQLQEKYIASERKDKAIAKKINNLQLKLQNEILPRIAGVKRLEENQNINDQVRGWIEERLQKQFELEFARASVLSYDAELAKLQFRKKRLLESDGHLAELGAEKETLVKDYLSAKDKFEQARFFAEGTENPLSIAEPPTVAEKREPSYRPFFAGFAGIAGGTMACFVIFLLIFFDTSVQTPLLFRELVGLPMLGLVNSIKPGKLSLDTLFQTQHPKGNLEDFKESIRKLRSRIQTAEAKSFLFVSPKEREGKSFLIALLAYAFSLNDKRILIIDTNFKNNTLSQLKSLPFFNSANDGRGPKKMLGGQAGLKKFLPNENSSEVNFISENVDIIGNKGGNQSPSEVLAGKDFQKILYTYAEKYDYIFMEAAAMNNYSDAMELAAYADKLVAVFSAQSAIKNTDKQTIEYLRQAGDKFLGAILNKVDLKNIA